MNDASKDFDHVMKDLKELRADVAKLMGSARHAAIDGVDSAYDSLRSRAQEPIETVTEYVRAQPFTGLLLAFGIGYIVGGLNRHR